jgi:imidazole glycerol-phosphate synthase subunit HisH
MTGIIDYGLGNLFSLEKALKRNHTAYVISASPDQLKNCDRFILSGVGHFEYGMQQLQQKTLLDFVKQQTEEGKSLLGICLGMQLLCTSSEEGNVPGLNLIHAHVKKLHVAAPQKIPHIGWNTVSDRDNNPLFKDIDTESKFYFTHSFAVLETPGFGAGTTTYGQATFHSVIRKNNLYGVQFHPEKSFDQGLTLLKNFCAL